METVRSFQVSVVLRMNQLQFWEEYYFEQLTMGQIHEIWLNNKEEIEELKTVFVFSSAKHFFIFVNDAKLDCRKQLYHTYYKFRLSC